MYLFDVFPESSGDISRMTISFRISIIVAPSCPTISPTVRTAISPLGDLRDTLAASRFISTTFNAFKEQSVNAVFPAHNKELLKINTARPITARNLWDVLTVIIILSSPLSVYSGSTLLSTIRMESTSICWRCSTVEGSLRSHNCWVNSILFKYNGSGTVIP